MKIRCLLVDDEPPALDVLEGYVRAVDTLELVGRCTNALQAYPFLQQRGVDLLFLDIKMPQVLGTDFVRSLRNPPPVIFTTAYREYALEGYELNVVDYLLKPIAFERFLRAIDKISRGGSSQFPPATAPVAIANQDAFTYFRTDRKAIKVFLRDIQYIESLKDYIRVVITGTKPLLVKQSISSLADLLPAEEFVRIHRSYIVGLAYVSSYTSQQLEVAGHQLPVGGLYQKEVLRALKLSDT